MEQSHSWEAYAQLIHNSAPFMEPEDSLLCSEEPTTVLNQMNPVQTLTLY
jgi:hypothetical protein